MCVLNMTTKEFQVDLRKPLVFQVGHLGEGYQEWVQKPILGNEMPRFFESNFLEFFTRTTWWVIPIVWLPVVCWLIMISIHKGTTLPQAILLIIVGLFVWTLFEYTFHRFFLHKQTKNYWEITFHYLFHGCHHKHPMDRFRITFPPVVTAIVCIPFWSIVRALSSPASSPAIFSGALLGYVMYDCIHYHLHTRSPSSKPVRHLKHHHLDHHYKAQTKGFGISSSLWDVVFGTMAAAKASS